MRRLLSVAVAAVASVLLIASSAGVVQAQSAGLGITPRRDLVVEPGQTKTGRLQVTNLDKQESLSLALQIIDFGAQDETGTPSLKLEANAPQTAWSLKPFLTAPSSLSLKAGESKYIDFSIAIPKSQGAGSYYSAIRYIADGADGGNVAVSASGATLVFVTVPGETKESLILQKFGAYDIQNDQANGTFRSVFVSSQPTNLAFTVKNQGNVAEQPAGSVIVKNMFGKEVKVIKDINPKSSLALRDQTRRFDMCIVASEQEDSNDAVVCKDPGLWPGRYSASLSAYYGLNGNVNQEILASASFWYLPAWFIIALLVVLAAIAIGIFLTYRRFTGGRTFSRKK